MIVEEIIFVLGGSVKYLGPKVAEICEWLSRGHVYCQTYFQMLAVMDAGRGCGGCNFQCQNNRVGWKLVNVLVKMMGIFARKDDPFPLGLWIPLSSPTYCPPFLGWLFEKTASLSSPGCPCCFVSNS